MLLEEKIAQDCTETIVRLLSRLNSLKEGKEIDYTILKLQSLDFNLDSINANGYSVIGIFKHNNFNKEIYIPFYKINEDILDQLESLVEEYNTYILEEQNQIYENVQSRTKGIELININSNKINWDKVYNTKIYAQIALNTTNELLYSKLNQELETIKYFRSRFRN